MKVKHLFLLPFLICLYGCSRSSDDQVDSPGEKQFILNQYHYSQSGVSIVNCPRQGLTYIDSAGVEYKYRQNTITIWNDSTVAIQLEIDFSNKGMDLKDSIRSKRSKFFLLPRHLTPNEQHLGIGGTREELQWFLDFEIDYPLHLSKLLKPTEKCVLTFGVLTDTKYPDPTTPFETRLLTSYENSSTIALKLKINDSLIIPCGQFTYMER